MARSYFLKAWEELAKGFRIRKQSVLQLERAKHAAGTRWHSAKERPSCEGRWPEDAIFEEVRRVGRRPDDGIRTNHNRRNA